MTRIEDTFGIKRSSSILPTHNLTTIDSNVRVVFQRAFKTLLNNVFLFLLNIKVKLENTIQSYKLTLPTHNDNNFSLGQNDRKYLLTAKERLTNAIASKFNTQEVLCLCLSVPLLIILGFLTILKPSFKTEEHYIEDNIVYNDYSPDLKYFIHKEDESQSQTNRFLTSNKVYTKQSYASHQDLTTNSVRYNVVGINSFRKAKSRDGSLFNATFVHASNEH